MQKRHKSEIRYANAIVGKIIKASHNYKGQVCRAADVFDKPDEKRRKRTLSQSPTWKCLFPRPLKEMDMEEKV